MELFSQAGGETLRNDQYWRDFNLLFLSHFNGMMILIEHFVGWDIQ